MMNSGRKDLRARVFDAGLRALGATGLPRLVASYTRGSGAILMFHHVRPWEERAFAPNRGLEITPEFLDECLKSLRDGGFDIIPLDAVPDRIRADAGRPFAALTFDDGYRDNLIHALPVLERHRAPFTINITTAFADGTGRLWWTELEEAVKALMEVPFAGEVLAAGTVEEKTASFFKVYWSLRASSEKRLLDEIARLASLAGVDGAALTRGLCMAWDEIIELSRHELCAIGAHTLTHARLAKLTAEEARREIGESREIIQTHIGKPVRHFAYPVGDPTSAGPREFRIAAELGFSTAVTTRKGMVFPEHAADTCALPRLSINGGFQRRAFIDLLLTGAPFLLWNRGRRVAA